MNKLTEEQKTESEAWVESASNWDRGLLVTLNLWHHFQAKKDDNTLFSIRKKITKFRETLEGKVFKDKNKHIEIFPVIHRKTESNHIHILLNTPQHIQRKPYIAKIKEIVYKIYADNMATYNKRLIINFSEEDVYEKQSTQDSKN